MHIIVKPFGPSGTVPYRVSPWFFRASPLLQNSKGTHRHVTSREAASRCVKCTGWENVIKWGRGGWQDIADSPVRHRERSAARRNAQRRPRSNGLRSRWIVRSQDCRRRLLVRHQSAGWRPCSWCARVMLDGAAQ